MKRTLFAASALLGVSLISGVSIAIAKDAKKDANQEKSAAAAPAKPNEKVAYTFADQAKVDAFAKLWQQRQATVLRMTVLKSYFLEEEDTLRKLNDEFAKDYNLDVTKNYKFDSDRKVILEIDAPQAAMPPQAGAPAAGAPAKGGSP